MGFIAFMAMLTEIPGDPGFGFALFCLNSAYRCIALTAIRIETCAGHARTDQKAYQIENMVPGYGDNRNK